MPFLSEYQSHLSAVRGLLGTAGIVVLAPHPDDETLGCGALLAACFAAGQQAHVVVVTKGEKSHPGSADWPADRLAEVRRAEVTTAVETLGGARSDLSFLGLPDSGAPNAGSGMESAAEAVAAILRDTGARTLISASGADPHCDHEATAAIARATAAKCAGVRLLFYPVWSRRAGVDLAEGGRFTLHRLPLGPWAERKRAALAAHRSQLGQVVTDDPEGFVLPADFAEMFLSEDEIYLEAVDATVDQ